MGIGYSGVEFEQETSCALYRSGILMKEKKSPDLLLYR